MQDVESGADTSMFQFERKIALSIYMNPSVYYVGVGTSGPYPFFQLTKDANKAVQFALYRVLGATPVDTYVLQYAPASDTPDLLVGALLAVWGSGAGPTGLMPTVEMRAATRFTLQRRGEEYHFQVQSNGLFLTAEAITGTPTFYLAKDGDLFHGHAWTARTSVLWNAQNMDNADLRYVTWLKNGCQPGSSFRNAKLRNASFREAALADAHFDGADCTNASFMDADISRCTLTGATLKKTMLDGAVASGLIAPKAKFDEVTFNVSSKATVFDGADLDDAIFDNGNLAGARFVKAKLARATFLNCTLGPTTSFSEAEMPGAILDGAKAAGVSFEAAKLGGASLSKTQLQGATFKTAALSGAKFTDAAFGSIGTGPKTDFTGATLYGIDFSGCNLAQATLATPSKFVEKPDQAPTTQTPRAGLQRCTIPLAVLGTSDWRNLDLSGATIQGTLPASLNGFLADYCIFPDDYNLTNRTLLNARFGHAQLVGADLGNADAGTAESREQAPDFSHADLTRAKLIEANLPMGRFDGAKMHGVKMSKAKLKQASFVGARLDTKVESGKTLTADLSYCVLLDANFENAFLGKGQSNLGANLSYVSFSGEQAKISNATLDGAQFSGAYLTAVDFTGNSDKSMEGVNFAGACLANCTFKKASLERAILTNACLFGADFTDATLHGASMTNASLSFTPLQLKATRPDTRVVTVDCRATVIEPKATDESTSCPLNGKSGPCRDSAWQRSGGIVTVWPIPST